MLPHLLGGVGLFLVGMTLMTEGLKRLTGDALQRALARLAGGRLSSLLTGAAVTAVVQSSSATTLTTIGFVSAGLLTFPQAIGVIFGANVGTTSTGWLVSLLGLKMSVSKVALPLVGLGALLQLLARERLAALGRALAGFGLVFVGIDTLQAGMISLSAWVTPDHFPAASWLGRALLVGVGVVMTVVMQSSSAAAAATLAALSARTIGLDQAAALVIGQNVGTTVTAGIAALGASVAAKRTAVAHVLFNLLTGVVAFAILPLFVRVVDRLAESLGGTDDAISLAAFHTVFNLMGVAMLLPFTDRFARLVERLIPQRGPDFSRHLDRNVARVPPVAMETARRTLREVTEATLGLVEARLGGHEVAPTRWEPARTALGQLRRFVAEVRTEAESAATHARHLAALHVLDHLDRLLATGAEGAAATAATDPALADMRDRLRDALRTARPWLATGEGPPPAEVAGVAVELERLRGRERPRIIAETAAGRTDPDTALRRLEAVRWMETVGQHLVRIAHHLTGPAPADIQAAAV